MPSQDSNTKSVKPRARRLRWLLILLSALLLVGGAFSLRYILWVQQVNRTLDAIWQGEFDKAKDDAEFCLNLMSVFPDSKSYALTLRMLMTLYACRRQFDQAEPYLNRLLEFDAKTWGKNSPDYAKDLADLALMRRKQSRFSEAEKLYSEAVDILAKCSDREAKLEAARYQALLAWVLICQNKFDEAADLLLHSESTLREAFGEYHFERLVPLIETAYLKKKLAAKPASLEANPANLDAKPASLDANPATHTSSSVERDAKALMNEAFKIITEPAALEKSSAQTVVVLNLLAQMFAEENEPDTSLKALRTFEIAAANCKASVFGGEYNIYMTDILKPHADLLTRLGREREAEQLRLRAQELRKLNVK